MEALKTALESTGLPVTYYAWDEDEEYVPALPFICYLFAEDNPLYADGGVYYNSADMLVELYTAFKDPATEKKVEAALRAYHWKKREDYIDAEKCFLIRYEIEV